MTIIERARQHFQVASRLANAGRLDEAANHYSAILGIIPEQPDAMYGLALVCLHSGRFKAAEGYFERVLAQKPAHPGALMGLGEALSQLGFQEKAASAFHRLTEVEPRNDSAHYARGQMHKQLGEFGLAQAAFTTAASLSPTNPQYHLALAECVPFTETDKRLQSLESLLRHEAAYSAVQKAELHFALFRAYHDLKRVDEAFDHLKTANSVYRKTLPYDEAEVLALFGEIQRNYTPAIIAEFSGGGHSSDVPIFVVGMPRSGTTLVEQILASHPDIYGAGELFLVQDLILDGHAGRDYPADLSALGRQGLQQFGGLYAARLLELAPKAKRIVDKLPANFRHLGLLHLALPNAKFIQVHRDPRDTCFSCYAQLFSNGLNFAYDLTELGHYCKAADELMARWSSILPKSALLDVQYETLINDLEGETRRLIKFCGLEWDSAVLRFYETKRAVRTKSEYQVRRPIYKSSIGRWRTYEKWLSPLLTALE